MITLIKYDLNYLLKTKKFIIISVVVGIFSLLSPIMAKYLPELLNSLMTPEGIQITIPEPTVMDAYRQYFSDMNETILFVILFFAISIFISEKTKGMLPLILSKPISRRDYIISKFITLIILITISQIIGILGFSLYTYVLFDEIAFGSFLLSNIPQLLYFVFVISICLFFATIHKSYLAALLSSFGVYFVLALLSVITVGPFKYFPVSLTKLFSQIILNVADVKDILISLAVTLVMIIGLVYGSIKIFTNQEVTR
ncbi:ABC transporter permease subunit [Mycoplasmatota bacterium]|nr:ABC transporter permease subunit [Mycoplasmatota bacterium]